MEFKPGQTSLINWLTLTRKHEQVLLDSIRYDNEKTERLESLHRLAGLPINTTHYINGEDFLLSSKRIQDILVARGGPIKLHSFRIAPQEEYAGTFAITKKYGVTFAEFAHYFASLPINPAHAVIRITDYRKKLRGAAIVIVNAQGMIGEVTSGTLYTLTYAQELRPAQELAPFYLEYGKNLHVLSSDEFLQQLAKRVLNFLKIHEPAMQGQLEKAGFPLHHNYLAGYYEYIEGIDGDAAFTDMNHKQITNNIDVPSSIAFLKQGDAQSQKSIWGLVAHRSAGKLCGTIQIIESPADENFTEGNILVCKLTDVHYLPLMQKAKAIITDLGGITSHPAIIARELNIPCLVGTKSATKALRNGDQVEIDMETGTVRRLN